MILIFLSLNFRATDCEEVVLGVLERRNEFQPRADYRYLKVVF